MNKQTYLEILTEQIRCKKVLPLVTEELSAHIEDQKTEYMSEGMTEKEAEEEAVRQMGDPVEVGIEMDRIHRPKTAWGMIGGIVLLSLLGVCLLYILQLRLGNQGVCFFYGQGIQNLLDDLLKMMIGLGVMVGVCYIDYSWIGKWAKRIMVVMILLLASGMFGLGLEINGASNWINLGIGTLTLSTLAFLTVPLYGAVLYQYRGQGYRGIVVSVLWMIAPVYFVLRIPRTFQACILAMAYLLVLSVAILKGWYKIKMKRTLAVLWGTMFLVPLAGCMKIMMSGPSYMANRIRGMFPWIFEGNIEAGIERDYQRHALRKLISGSQIVGANKYMGQTALEFTEGLNYILTYILVCYGILAAILLVGTIVYFILRLFRISFSQKNQLGMIMGTGCTVIFLLQIILYIMVNLGWMPTTSVYCPFITYSGTWMLVTYIMLGLLLSIYRYQNVLADQTPRMYQNVKETCR